ncbi:MAG: AEC family transporter [Firmicutes bacterium]|nr:AEC family transporter [Bacillota bacterium]
MFFDTLLFSLNAIIPVILLILLGYYLKKRGFIEEYLIRKMNQYIFIIALPLLFFYNVYQTETLKNVDLGMLFFSASGLVLFAIIGYVVLLFVKMPLNQKGPVHQSFTRSNFAMIGVSLAAFIGTRETNALLSLSAVLIIPLSNFISIIVLSIFYKEEKRHLDFMYILKTFFKNPLIIGVLTGIFFVVLKTYFVSENNQPIILIERDVPFLYNMSLSQTATPIALIALGAQFEFKTLSSSKKAIFTSVLFRNFIIPISMVILTILLIPINEDYRLLIPTMIALYASPVAVSSVVMVQNLGGDEEVAGQLVVWTTLFSSVTIFGSIMVLRMLGYL